GDSGLSISLPASRARSIIEPRGGRAGMLVDAPRDPWGSRWAAGRPYGFFPWSGRRSPPRRLLASRPRGRASSSTVSVRSPGSVRLSYPSRWALNGFFDGHGPVPPLLGERTMTRHDSAAPAAGSPEQVEQRPV